MNQENYKFIRVQLSIFTPTLLFNKSKIFENLLTKFGSIFDGEPISLPLPKHAPKSIPRIILSDKYEKRKVEISESRFNISIGKQEESETIIKDVFISKDIANRTKKIVYWPQFRIAMWDYTENKLNLP